MCYFIHLKITEERSPDAVEETAARLADSHGVCLRGRYPAFYVTDGHCSCDYVHNNQRAISVAAFVEALVKAESVKRVEIGGTWGERMKPEAVLERLLLQEFLALNTEAGLQQEIWYRLHDPTKYRFAANP